MVRTKLILTSFLNVVGILRTAWLIFERQAAHERRATVFDPSRDYPTSGGHKMKVEW
ncbi:MULTISPECIES: entry exclusion protein TrbK [Rhizobium]|uniref:entry exclusion protein TrbK n=1 Tax=unclassified Rhizobium TaxID=2613769 RepID=UPI000BBD4EC8|nr:entry exclusion protein TrbK [Rhizobium sophoriradicis]PDS72826.1 entry exclusion protein TrbK [Rhizobium sp. L43]